MIETKVWTVSLDEMKDEIKHKSAALLEEPARLLSMGKLIAFPTETVYGLGANALDQEAAGRIFAAKGRPADNPLIVHIANERDLESLVREIPPAALPLIKRFWPGPLTLVMKAGSQVPQVVTGGLDTVALRMPAHSVALELIRLAGVPVAAPSANRSGRPSPTRAEHVLQDLSGRIEGVVDGGPCQVGLESTVLDITGTVPVVLRPGGVTVEMLREVIGANSANANLIDANLTKANSSNANFAPRSPGMKYTHYAPQAPVYLLSGQWEEQTNLLARLLNNMEIFNLMKQPDNFPVEIGLLVSDQTASRLELDHKGFDSKILSLNIQTLGSREDMAAIASSLFDDLRAFDQTDVKLILAETYPAKGLGEAVMNRLEKAAGSKWI